ncbi:MAG: hypothetical protein ACRBHB_21785 [Arenicella sp.]
MLYRKLLVPGIVMLSSVLSACTSIGPQAIKGTRMQYNQAVQATNIQQLLLNLVRLHHDDTVFFIDVSSITSTVSLTNSPTLTVAKTFTSSSIVDTLSFTDAPVITYTPLQGDSFVNELLAPLDLSQFILLSEAGWDVTRLMLTTLKQINHNYNESSADGSNADDYQRFITITKLLQALEDDHLMELNYSVKNKVVLPVIHFKKEAFTSSAGKQLKEKLGLADGFDTFYLSDNIGDESNKQVIQIQTRSLMDIMRSLSVLVKKTDDGRCSKNVDAIFSICSGREKPGRNVFSKIRYADKWFHVDDDDKQSKLTLSFLSQIFALQSGTTLATGPSVTIPAN